jgi:hypothetical protein
MERSEAMDNTLHSAEALIQLQGKVNARMMDLSRLLSQRTEIRSTARMCEVRQYPNGTRFEACVDVETIFDTAVSFWFEFGCEGERWHVAASISKTVSEGQDIIEEYPESSPTNIEQLVSIATQGSEWLAKRGQEFNFDELR